MDSEPDSSGHKSSRPPGRQSSRRQALPRRFTKGPLGSAVEDDPLSTSTTSTDDTENAQSAPEDVPASETNSPAPPSSTKSPLPEEPSVSVVERPSKNLNFLLKPSNFLPINLQDLPPPFRTAQPTNPSVSLSTLLSNGQFLSAATLSATTLSSLTDPTDYTLIFSLLYVRLICLQFLGYESNAAQESKILQDLNGSFYRERASGPFGTHLAPWDLRVLVVRLQALGFGDWRRAIMTYYELAREARYEVRRAKNEEEREEWRERLEDLGVRVGNALVEIGDLDGAARHLKTIAQKQENNGKIVDGNVLKTRLCLAFLQTGDTDAAARCLDGWASEGKGSESAETSRRMLEALCMMAEGNFADAIPLWQGLHDYADSVRDHAVAAQNMAICCLYTGDVGKACNLLEGLVDVSSVPTGITFNLATVYELCSERSREVKLKLAERLAKTEGSDLGWDRLNADFKL